MQQRILMTCALALSLLLSAMAQNNRKPQDDPGRPPAGLPQLVDPGFESFTPARAPVSGWYSADLEYLNDRRFASLKLTPDSRIKAEGKYSLRIEQDRARPLGLGQASLSQTLRLPKRGGPSRSFDLSAQMRGELNGPVTIHVYVWEPGYIARAIAQRDVKVDTEWRTATVRFNVPDGYDEFGIFFYLPRDDESQLWLDDIRLTPSAR